MGVFKPEYFSDYQQLSIAASKLIVNRISIGGTFQIGVSAGQSPLRTYQLVADEIRSNPILCDKIEIFQLDEWLGVSSKDIQSCQHFIHRHITVPWQIKTENCFLLEGEGVDQRDQIKRMKEHLSRRPLDLCILGLGINGHLALNEPGSQKKDPSRIVALTANSQSHTMLKGHGDRVTKGITIGLKEILESREVLLLISGINKSVATKELLSAKVNPDLPASFLVEHPNWHCYVDKNVIE